MRRIEGIRRIIQFTPRIHHQIDSRCSNDIWTGDQAQAKGTSKGWPTQNLASLTTFNKENHEGPKVEAECFTGYLQDEDFDQEGTERTIPYDLIPRVIEKKQWEKISTGCEQRVKALNYFLDDI